MQSSFASISTFHSPLAVHNKLSFFIVAQNKTLQDYLRVHIDCVHEIAAVSMNEPDDGMHLAISTPNRS
jgi:hypothetical protein